MAIDSISSATVAQLSGVGQGTAAFSRFKDLEEALQSGDLAAARKAFGSLQQIRNTDATPEAADGGGLKAAFDRVGITLQSGDSKAAQASLATLKQAARKTHGRHGHHEPAKSSPTTPTTHVAKASGTQPAFGLLGQSVDAIG